VCGERERGSTCSVGYGDIGKRYYCQIVKTVIDSRLILFNKNLEFYILGQFRLGFLAGASFLPYSVDTDIISLIFFRSGSDVLFFF
jgi:hypothetical protein